MVMQVEAQKMEMAVNFQHMVGENLPRVTAMESQDGSKAASAANWPWCEAFREYQQHASYFLCVPLQTGAKRNQVGRVGSRLRVRIHRRAMT